MADTDLLFLESGNFSVGFRVQTDLTTPAATGTATDWEWLDAIVQGPPTWAYEEGTDPKSSGQRGAKARKSVGRKVGTWPIRVEMPGQLVAYDPTSDSVVAVGAWKLLFGALGASAQGAYAANGVKALAGGSTANQIDTTEALKLGLAYAIAQGASSSAIRCIGIIESVAGGLAQLAFDMNAVPVEADNLYAMLTAWPAKADSEAYTFRLCGELAAQDHRYIGSVLELCELTWDSSGRVYGDFTLTIYAGQDKGSDGGLKDLSGPYKQIDEYSGMGNAHLVIGQTVRTALDDGTADDGVCGTTNHKLTMNFGPHRTVTCPGATERVGAVALRAPDIMVSFDADDSPSWEDADGVNLFESYYKSQEAVPYALTVGATAGCCFGVHIPGALVTKCGDATIDGAKGYNVELVPGPNTGDGASTNAGNKPFRIAIG